MAKSPCFTLSAWKSSSFLSPPELDTIADTRHEESRTDLSDIKSIRRQVHAFLTWPPRGCSNRLLKNSLIIYNYDVTGSDFLDWLSQVHVPTFSGKEHFRSLLALDDNIELDSFTDVAINETTESKAKKSKIKTELEENDLLADF